MRPKYSLIIPSRNGIKYLPSCIETILVQNYQDYELIISDDHSDDSTEEYLETLKQSNISVIRPPHSMSMADHWEWALSHANGEWLMFVGQDDGIQQYFFSLVDKLTAIANENSIRSITSRRAYFFWPGCEKIYGDAAVRYNATNRIKMVNLKIQAFLALLGFKSYFELPQMYTTSLFHRSLIEEAKKMQEGQLFVTHPQDANLAAISCSLEKKTLVCDIPLGWVGSSPKSAGMAVSANNKNKSVKDLYELENDYLSKIKKSQIRCHPLAGDFKLGLTSIYFFGALLQTGSLRGKAINKFIISKIFRTLIFAGSFAKLNGNSSKNRFEYFYEVVSINNCSIKFVKMLSNLFRLLHYSFKKYQALVFRFNKVFNTTISYRINWSNNPETSLLKESEKISNMKMINKMIINIEAKSNK